MSIVGATPDDYQRALRLPVSALIDRDEVLHAPGRRRCRSAPAESIKFRALRPFYSGAAIASGARDTPQCRPNLLRRPDDDDADDHVYDVSRNHNDRQIRDKRRYGRKIETTDPFDELRLEHALEGRDEGAAERHHEAGKGRR